MRVDLDGKVALVTGSTRGIGKAIALSLAANGAKVVVHGRDMEKGRDVVEEVKGSGGEATFIEADIGSLDRVNTLISESIELYGTIDILVNNAGINVDQKGRVPVHEFTEENWHLIVNTNLNGVYYCTKGVAKHMVQRKTGKIINISSVVGLVPLRLQSAFAAAKAGVIHFTKATALELASFGINVNCIAPGSILVEGTYDLFYSDEEKKESLLDNIPFKRPGTCEEIAHAALFLASNSSDYMTGSVMVIDGGWICGFAREW